MYEEAVALARRARLVRAAEGAAAELAVEVEEETIEEETEELTFAELTMVLDETGSDDTIEEEEADTVEDTVEGTEAIK